MRKPVGTLLIEGAYDQGSLCVVMTNPPYSMGFYKRLNRIHIRSTDLIRVLGIEVPETFFPDEDDTTDDATVMRHDESMKLHRCELEALEGLRQYHTLAPRDMIVYHLADGRVFLVRHVYSRNGKEERFELPKRLTTPQITPEMWGLESLPSQQQPQAPQQGHQEAYDPVLRENHISPTTEQEPELVLAPSQETEPASAQSQGAPSCRLF